MDIKGECFEQHDYHFLRRDRFTNLEGFEYFADVLACRNCGKHIHKNKVFIVDTKTDENSA